MLRLFRAYPHILVCLLLAAVTVTVYWQVLGHEFVSLDDDVYLTRNPHVQHGFTWESVAWAFSSHYASNWHPLTWLSHMLDWRLYGADPMGHHLTNLLLHLVSVLLLFVLLSRVTGFMWRSAFVAAIFAIHPLHVESVAWAAERKDVLSALFWILTIWAYVRYTERPRLGRYLVVGLSLGLGLMAKPMLVTLPLILLLMDFWPLGRLQGTGVGGRGSGADGKSQIPIRASVIEKVPLLALVGASAVLTVMAQSAGEALGTLERFPLGVRLANAVVSYVVYAAKTLWPADLGSFYAHPQTSLPGWQVVSSSAGLVLFTVLLVRARRSRPYLLVGWLWYVISLLPVIGIAQVGTQGHADRYMYIPMIGLSLMIAWGIPEALAHHGASFARAVCALAALAALSGLSLACYFQVGVWRDSVTLFSRTVAVNPNSDGAHHILGIELAKRGEFSEAIVHYRRAVAINPNSAAAHNDLAYALEQVGDLSGAIRQYHESLRAEPGVANTHNDLGLSLISAGRLDEAIAQFKEAVHLAPSYADAHTNLGTALAMKERTGEAIVHYSQALRLNPDDADARRNLAIALEHVRNRPR